MRHPSLSRFLILNLGLAIFIANTAPGNIGTDTGNISQVSLETPTLKTDNRPRWQRKHGKELGLGDSAVLKT